MAFDTLEHRDVSQIDWMFERLVGFVARLTLAVGKCAEVDRVLHGNGFDDRRGPR